MKRSTISMKNNVNKKRDKQIIAEANARRKVNEKWQQVANDRKYKYAAIKQASHNTTVMIEAECFDGILLQLNVRNETKPYSTQKRILRRIVEKRQAQSIHRTIGRTKDRFSNHMENRIISKSVKDLRRLQFCISW